jgi:Raf kinase inhibitor-like YbhB/YbcL family protein
MIRTKKFVLYAAGIMLACSTAAHAAEKSSFEIKSAAFQNAADIPRKHTCDAGDVSPALSWMDAPAGTRTFALIVEDPDAPGGTWVHWVLYDLPANAKELPEGVAADKPPGGAKQGVNDFRKPGYGGPCPPRGTHRYYFKLYALDAPTELKPGATKQQLLAAIKGHVLAEAELVGKYGR